MKYLHIHEQRHEEEDTALRCGECTRTFSNRQNLLRHVRDCHPVQQDTGAGDDSLPTATTTAKKKRFRCEECDKDFVDSTRLKQHSWIHTGYHPYKYEEQEQFSDH